MISVVLPAYKEAENLKKILPNLHEALKDFEYEILVIDTMEPMDDTNIACTEYNAIYTPREDGNSYGDAIRTGFKKANGDYIVIMDADGSHNSKDILRFYDVILKEQSDLIIGSRYCKGGKTDNSFLLLMMSKLLNYIYRIVFNLNVKDVSDSFRMYKANHVKSLVLECQNFDIVEEILIKLSVIHKNYKITEIPINFNKRQAGNSKRNLVKFIFSYIVTIIKLLNIKRKLIENFDNSCIK